MALLTLQDIGLGYGGQSLFENVRLRIEAGERLCLVGRNGVGKSTLLKIISGDLKPDHGTLRRQPHVNIAALPQEVPQQLAGRVYDVVISGLGRSSAALAEYHRVSRQLAEQGDDRLLAELGAIQQRLEADGGWRLFQRTEAAISQMGLDAEAQVETLSAGLKRRVLLARALVQTPDLLLLDEPTNHLDVESISWLEEELLRLRCALLFITHDRAFLRRLATRIVEIDRGRLFDWPGDYDTYLRRKAEDLATESVQQELFDKKLVQEEAWIRQGIKARRTRNEGRVRRLEAMREERKQRRRKIGQAKISMQEAERSGKRVIRATNLHFAYDKTPIVEGFSTSIHRGDRIGILGPNGAGKTTLLRLLLGQLEPQQGEVEHGTKLEIAYFDQLRDQLDEEKSTQDNIAGGREFLDLNGKRRHVISYLQDFLFSPDRARSPVAQLSGGERHRLLLAKLFTQPSNVLVLDEPTNDLDVETLELLEERLIEYGGTVLTVSHDRAFLNHVVTSVIAFEGPAQAYEYVGGYDDWLRQRRSVEEPPQPTESKGEAKPKPPTSGQRAPKLSYKEKTELGALPEQIEALEKEQGKLHEQLNDPAFYQRPHEEVSSTTERLKAVEAELEAAYDRWAELQEKEELSRRPTTS